MQKNGIRKKMVISCFLITLIVIAAVSVFFIVNTGKLVSGEVLDRIISELLFITPFILAFVVLIIYLIASKIVAPIKKLREAAGFLAKGDLNREVSVKTQDEFEDMANSLNEMALNLRSDKIELQRYSQGLEKTVKEKMEDLENKVIDLKIARDKILSAANDIDEERQKTIKEKDKIDAILHSIGDGVFVVDKDLRVVIINEVAANMAGYKAEEVLGKKYTDKLKFIFEETGKVNSQFIDKAFETKAVQKMSNHTVLIDKDGNKIQVSDSAAPLLDADFNVVGCVVVFRNVTKERDVDKAKSEFVSLASHQLRTPLSVINWYSEMLLGGDVGKLNEDQKKYVEEVYKGNQRMVELVNSLLNVSRLELGTFIVEPEPTDIVALAKSAASELKPQIAGKKLSFKEYYGDSLPMFNADSKLLRMVFQNLLSNAVKYTPDNGEVSVNISIIDAGENLGDKKVEEKSFAISVSDTGYGITAGQQDKIFSKLFRADNARGKDTEGTGLGLYIVKAIVDLSGGSIWFKSEENKGTAFYITLPIGGMKKKEGAKKLG
ncbi:PAS domain-containing protein [Patescibacteria group bacterium]|nr:PAS domain-containing protein [Patescibacteria group bacterium]